MAIIPVTHELLSFNKEGNITQLLSIQELLQSWKTEKKEVGGMREWQQKVRSAQCCAGIEKPQPCHFLMSHHELCSPPAGWCCHRGSPPPLSRCLTEAPLRPRLRPATAGDARWLCPSAQHSSEGVDTSRELYTCIMHLTSANTEQADLYASKDHHYTQRLWTHGPDSTYLQITGRKRYAFLATHYESIAIQCMLRNSLILISHVWYLP